MCTLEILCDNTIPLIFHNILGFQYFLTSEVVKCQSLALFLSSIFGMIRQKISENPKKNYGLNFWKGHISKDTGLKIIVFAINKSKLDAFMANEVNFEIL